MTLQAEITGAEAVERELRDLGGRLDRSFSGSIEDLTAELDRTVPRRTGRLANSRRVELRQNEAVIDYTAKYAWRVERRRGWIDAALGAWSPERRF